MQPIVANDGGRQRQLETDGGLRQREFEQDRRAYYLLFVGMFATSLVLIVISLLKRVLRPLRRLMDFRTSYPKAISSADRLEPAR